MLFFIKLFLNSRFVSVYGILGGHNIEIEAVPYQVNYGDVCAGVLIHQKWALTTAHCGTNKSFIRVGSTRRLKGTKITIAEHIVNPKYNKQKKHEFDYDIQLLKLNRSLHLQKTIRTISIHEGGGSILVSGWGYSKEKGEYEDHLKQIEIYKVPFDHCQNYSQKWYNHTLTDRMFCAGGNKKDACQGDSGTGAVSKGYLIGISTFGYGCGRGYPGVYINVTEHRIRSWIRDTAGV